MGLIGWVDIAYEMLGGRGTTSTSVRYGVDGRPSGDSLKNADPQNMTTVYTCTKILSNSLSMLPLEVLKNTKADKDNPLYGRLKFRLSKYYTNQTLWSTVEYHRNTAGNGFIDIRKNNWEIIHPNVVTDYKYENGELWYKLTWACDPQFTKRLGETRSEEWVVSADILHFKGVSVDGVMGLPPVSAAMHNMNLLNKATATITSFYDNRAMPPFSLESTVQTSGAARAAKNSKGDFVEQYIGTGNYGKPIQLPPNTKLTPLQIQFQDAQLIETMKFSQAEIYKMYGIPSFMQSSPSEVQMDIEQQSLNFRLFAILPITTIYETELRFKLFSVENLVKGADVMFNTDVMIDMDIVAKANAFSKYIQNGLMSPNEAALRVGTEPIKDAIGDSKFLQAQMIPLDQYSLYNPLLKDDPSGKTISGDTKKTKEKEEGKTKA